MNPTTKSTSFPGLLTFAEVNSPGDEVATKSFFENLKFNPFFTSDKHLLDNVNDNPFNESNEPRISPSEYKPT